MSRLFTSAGVRLVRRPRLRTLVAAAVLLLGCGEQAEREGDPALGSGGSSAGAPATGGSAGAAGATAGGTGGGSGGEPVLTWRQANLTNFTSYPDPNSEECVAYNGCTWAGQFAALDGVQPESWVMANDIIAVHSKDFEQYELKTLRLRKADREIDAIVYDMCADSDCDGCCTANSAETGFLIDIEKYTMMRFGYGHTIVEWACLDCP